MDKFIVHFKSVSKPDFGSVIQIHNAFNAKDAQDKAYAQLIGSQSGKDMIWEFDRVEVGE